LAQAIRTKELEVQRLCAAMTVKRATPSQYPGQLSTAVSGIERQHATREASERDLYEEVSAKPVGSKDILPPRDYLGSSSATAPPREHEHNPAATSVAAQPSRALRSSATFPPSELQQVDPCSSTYLPQKARMPDPFRREESQEATAATAQLPARIPSQPETFETQGPGTHDPPGAPHHTEDSSSDGLPSEPPEEPWDVCSSEHIPSKISSTSRVEHWNSSLPMSTTYPRHEEGSLLPVGYSPNAPPRHAEATSALGQFTGCPVSAVLDREHPATCTKELDLWSSTQLPPWAMMADPCNKDRAVPIIAFQCPGGAEGPCDQLFQHAVFGTLYPQGLTVRGTRYKNVEDAYQALRRCKPAEEQVLADASGAWQTMIEVLESKFKEHTCRLLLLHTGDSFLVALSSTASFLGGSSLWTNNQSGDGRNWLGAQLMFLRDRLLEEAGSTPTGWTRYMKETCGISPRTGSIDSDGKWKWQQAVKAATASVADALASNRNQLASASSAPAQSTQAAAPIGTDPLVTRSSSQAATPIAPKPSGLSSAAMPAASARPQVLSSIGAARGAAQSPMCIRCQQYPTHNGQPGQYCSLTCRNADKTSAHSASMPAAQPLCVGCGRMPTFNGLPGHYCSRKCRDTGAQAAPPASTAARGGQHLCKGCKTQVTFNGQPGYCSKACRTMG